MRSNTSRLNLRNHREGLGLRLRCEIMVPSNLKRRILLEVLSNDPSSFRGFSDNFKTVVQEYLGGTHEA